MREELQFKDHKLSEWENLLISERGKIKSLENELEVLYTCFSVVLIIYCPERISELRLGTFWVIVLQQVIRLLQ